MFFGKLDPTKPNGQRTTIYSVEYIRALLDIPKSVTYAVAASQPPNYAIRGAPDAVYKWLMLSQKTSLLCARFWSISVVCAYLGQRTPWPVFRCHVSCVISTHASHVTCCARPRARCAPVPVRGHLTRAAAGWSGCDDRHRSWCSLTAVSLLCVRPAVTRRRRRRRRRADLITR